MKPPALSSSLADDLLTGRQANAPMLASSDVICSFNTISAPEAQDSIATSNQRGDFTRTADLISAPLTFKGRHQTNTSRLQPCPEMRPAHGSLRRQLVPAPPALDNGPINRLSSKERHNHRTTTIEDKRSINRFLSLCANPPIDNYAFFVSRGQSRPSDHTDVP